jgi:hypothetical protein
MPFSWAWYCIPISEAKIQVPGDNPNQLADSDVRRERVDLMVIDQICISQQLQYT